MTASTSDPRLEIADAWKRHGDDLDRLMDELTSQCRHARSMERRLREQVIDEQEVARIQAVADAQLERPARGRKAA